VSVKRLTGTTTLAVDGKVDASNRSDMLTQKLIAHLPLLLHGRPREVATIGLGSGATVGSALRHPITRADVVEISPEVVEASRYFAAENDDALEDPRTNLIVGDGRSHLLLATRQYDVIISEPSNPWIAGVAALFTREFFQAARDRLAPGGLICQWANAYNISSRDLRAIVATFRSVFPNGTIWLVGTDDVLLLASASPLDDGLANLERQWTRPGVAADLEKVAVVEPFSIWSLFVGGPDELARYSGDAAILTDDRMTIEFSAPRELHSRSAGDHGATLAALLGADRGPSIVRRARASAGAVQWRNRGAMMAKTDAHAMAYDDYVRALTLDPGDIPALDGLVRSAVRIGQARDALAWVKSLTAGRPETPEVAIAMSKLLAANGFWTDAVEAAGRASRLARAGPRRSSSWRRSSPMPAIPVNSTRPWTG
jgi:SAM-dependent methyltransferase